MYIVMTSCAKMPNNVKSQYRNVAVVETTGPDVRPAMISERARGVRRIVRHYGPQNVGLNIRSAYARTVAAAEKLAANLNAADAGRAYVFDHFDR